MFLVVRDRTRKEKSRFVSSSSLPSVGVAVQVAGLEGSTLGDFFVITVGRGEPEP